MSRAARGLSADLAAYVLDFVSFPQQLASWCDDGNVTLWSRSAQRILGRHEGRVSGVRLFPDGARAATWGDDGLAVVWDASLSGGGAIAELRHSREVICLDVFPSGDRLVTCSGMGRGTVWDAESGEVLFYLARPQVWHAEVSPSGGRVVVWGRGGPATSHSAASGALVCEFRRRRHAVFFSKIFPDGGRVVTGGVQREAVIWSASCDELVRLELHTGSVTGVDVLGSGTKVAVMVSRAAVTIWDALTGALERAVDPSRGTSGCSDTALLPRSDLLVNLCDGQAVVWSSARVLVSRRLFGAPLSLRAPAVSAKGDMFAAYGEVAGGFRLAVFELPSGAVWRSEVLGRRACAIAAGPGTALDPWGFGGGAPWREFL